MLSINLYGYLIYSSLFIYELVRATTSIAESYV